MSDMDDDNQRPTTQIKGQRWSGGQVFVTSNDTEAHIQTIRKNRTT